MSRIQILLPAIALAVFGCGGDSDPSSPADVENDPAAFPVAGIELEGAVVMLWDRGVGTQITATAFDSRGQVIQGVIFEWTSGDPAVATVVDGEVRAAGNGWTEVTASAGGASESVSIVVATPDSPKDRTDCIACHADAYLGQHGGSNTPETCLQCHTGPTWTGGDFDHTAVSAGFELLGVHALLSCAACHEADGTPKYPGVADDQCVSCHQSDYDGQHGGSGTPTTCLQCHTRDAWSGGGFDHSTASSGFDLLGAHMSLACTACHEADGTPKYPGVADDQCVSCHQSDYDGQHGGSGTPTTCLQCHTRDAWSGGGFDHSTASSGFDLLGAHTSLACTACHEADGTPKYPGVGDNHCVACHQSDYDGEHSGSGYPTTCLTCHTRASFSGASFDHDAQYFPISFGKHQGKWSGCVTCHTDSSDYSNFTCFACHQHDQSRMDDKHSDVSGYAYDSDRCYACHPTGQGD